MSDRDSTFNPLTHFKVTDVPEPDADGKFPDKIWDPEQDHEITAIVKFNFFGKRTQAADFAERLQERLRVEVDSSMTVNKIEIVARAES